MQENTYRKERKFTANSLDIAYIKAIVRSHPAMFSQAFPARYVNNIYLDNSSNTSYNDNVVGAMKRRKFRIRWYGKDTKYIERPILEIKQKKGLAGNKIHIPLASFELKNGFSKDILYTVFRQSNIPESWQTILYRLSPVLMNQYHRYYFLSADRKFRLTLDSKLAFTKISTHHNFFSQQVKNDHKTVIELKYDIENDEIANHITQHLPFRLSKNSKFVNGLDNLSF